MKVTNFEGDDGSPDGKVIRSADVQVIRIGPPDIGTREGDEIIDVVAGKHGDEEITIDAARGVGLLAVANADELAERRIGFVITSVVAGNDYLLNQNRRGAKKYGKYIGNFCRFSQGNLESSYHLRDPPLGVRVQKYEMETFNPDTRLNFHSSLVQNPFWLASHQHQELSKIQVFLLQRYGFTRIGSFPDAEASPEVAPGVHPEMDSAFGLTSNAFLGIIRPSALRLMFEIQTWQPQFDKIDPATMSGLYKDAATAFGDASRRFLDKHADAEDPLDQLVINAASQRRAKRLEILAKAGDNPSFLDTVEHGLFLLRDLGVVGHALKILEGRPHRGHRSGTRVTCRRTRASRTDRPGTNVCVPAELRHGGDRDETRNRSVRRTPTRAGS